MSKNNQICGKCGGVVERESYTYIRNQPKNDSKVVLGPGPTYLSRQPMNTFEPYNYGYNYAMYRPEKHQNTPSEREEQAWPGVI